MAKQILPALEDWQEGDAQVAFLEDAGGGGQEGDVDHQKQTQLLDPGRRGVENVTAEDQPAEDGDLCRPL